MLLTTRYQITSFRASSLLWHHGVAAIHRADEEVQMTSPKTLSVAEAAKLYFGKCRNWGYTAVAAGRLPAIKIGRTIRVPVAALERMIDAAGDRIVIN